MIPFILDVAASLLIPLHLARQVCAYRLLRHIKRDAIISLSRVYASAHLLHIHGTRGAESFLVAVSSGW